MGLLLQAYWTHRGIIIDLLCTVNLCIFLKRFLPSLLLDGRKCTVIELDRLHEPSMCSCSSDCVLPPVLEAQQPAWPTRNLTVPPDKPLLHQPQFYFVFSDNQLNFACKQPELRCKQSTLYLLYISVSTLSACCSFLVLFITLKHIMR